jgi:hypothetical protein
MREPIGKGAVKARHASGKPQNLAGKSRNQETKLKVKAEGVRGKLQTEVPMLKSWAREN